MSTVFNVDSNGNVSANSYAGQGVPFCYTSAFITFAGSAITATEAQYECHDLICGGANSAQENLVVPLIAGAEWYVENSGTGYGIQVIGATGTGIVIPNNNGAIVRSDGVNILRKTPNATITS